MQNEKKRIYNLADRGNCGGKPSPTPTFSHPRLLRVDVSRKGAQKPRPHKLHIAFGSKPTPLMQNPTMKSEKDFCPILFKRKTLQRLGPVSCFHLSRFFRYCIRFGFLRCDYYFVSIQSYCETASCEVVLKYCSYLFTHAYIRALLKVRKSVDIEILLNDRIGFLGNGSFKLS